MVWDDKNIELLKKLWNNGLSTTEIAKKMNVSKNSIVGKVHRLCLKARPSPIKKKDDESAVSVVNETVTEPIQKPQQEPLPEEKKSRSRKKTKAEEPANLKPIDDTPAKEETSVAEKVIAETKKAPVQTAQRNIKLVDLDSHTCRWPIGDPREENFCFCGKKVRAGQTYCDEHSQVAYIKALSKK